MLSSADTHAVHDAARAVAALDPADGDGSPVSTLINAAATMAVATFIAASSPTSPAAADAATSATSDDSEPQGECQLMGSFAILVQAALGALALLSLVFKRWRERPQRPLKIWFFDVSKQVFGSVLVHIANIFMSLLTSGRFSVKIEPGVTSRLMARAEEEYIPNPCSFYLLNLAIDTTLGIPILIILLKIITGLFAFTPLGKPRESIQSGNYGNPPSAWWWLKQSVIYFMGLFGMKICVLIIFLVMPWISKVGDWALGWTEGNEKLQIAFVMMIFPLIMNAMQYYIIDSFIKKKETSDHERLPSEDPDEARAFGVEGQFGEELLTGTDSEGEDDLEVRDGKKHRSARTTEDEYDPDKDGEEPTRTGSGGSSREPHGPSKVVEPSLFPKE